MIIDNTTFILDGIKSEEMGLHIVRVSSGLYSTPLAGASTIIEEYPINQLLPVFQKIQRQPLSFEVTFSLLDEEFTPERRYEIAAWMFKDQYMKFQTTDDLDKIYYVIATNQVDFMSAGTKKGYFTVNFRCDAAWAWTSEYTEILDFSDIAEETEFILSSESNILKYYRPLIQIKMLEDSASDFVIKNKTDRNSEFIIDFTRTINDAPVDTYEKDEIISINMQSGNIESDNSYSYNRLQDTNKNWVRLVFGENTLSVNRKCLIKVTMQFPVFQ